MFLYAHRIGFARSEVFIAQNHTRCTEGIKAQGYGGMGTGEIADAVVGSVWVAMCICVCVWKYRKDGKL
jgi:hypothetical protein